MPVRRQAAILQRFCALACLSALWANTAFAGDFRHGFDAPEPTWEVRTDGEMQVRRHDRTNTAAVRGPAGELIELLAGPRGGRLHIEHPLPPSRVIEETRLALIVNAGFAVRASVRVVFPHQPNPRTDEPFTYFWAEGDTYNHNQIGRWQELSCKNLTQAVVRQIRLLRKQFNVREISDREVYIDRVRLEAVVGPGQHTLLVDELIFGPLVRARKDVQIAQIAHAEDNRLPVEMRSGRLHVDGIPFLPRLTPYLGDDPAILKDAGMNLIWVMEHNSDMDFSAMSAQGLWIAGTPPQALTPTGQPVPPGRVSLVPFSREAQPNLVWYMGTRLSPEARDDIVARIEQVAAADRKDHRPIMADVAGAEASYSRHVNMLGISRHVINTSLSFEEYRDWLIQKTREVLLGTFVWTWIQTEAAPADRDWREAAGHSQIAIEPEQIRLQTYAALSAGGRGIGFWRQSSFDQDIPAALERRLEITQLNLELELIGPWIATGQVVGQRSFTLERREPPPMTASVLGVRSGAASRRDLEHFVQQYKQQQKEEGQREPAQELQAAILQTDYGKLVLPVWYDQQAQYVPGKMAGENAKIVVEGVNRRTARAYEVSTTKILGLETKAATGGMEILLPHFDQTAIIVVTTDLTWKARFEQKIAGMAQKSAEISVRLAEAKLKRVTEIDRELQQLGSPQLDAPRILMQAREELDKAQSALNRGQYHWARFYSRNAMQSTRILQRAHWEEAVIGLSSPNSSPHTVCFQTLPDHHRMLEALGRSAYHPGENLLPSGDFEETVQAMSADGWEHEQMAVTGVRAAADLSPVRRPGNYCLSLIAVPATGFDSPASVERPPVRVTSPGIPVHAGDIIHISGWARVVAAPQGTFDGATLEDSLTGRRSALRWTKQQDWQRFQIIREVHTDAQLRLTLTLHGLGEVQFDDLQVLPHRPRENTAAPADNLAPTAETSGGDLDFLGRLNKFIP